MEEVSIRDGFGKGILEAGKSDPRVVVLCADLTDSTRVEWFRDQFPDRFFEIGIAEQNMAGVAAGLALSGKIPFITSFAEFSPGRNWEQIRISIAYNQANVKIVGSHSGLTVGEDGATHQMLEDIALMRVLPGMVVIVPCDAEQTKKATLALAQHKGPGYLRVSRPVSPVITGPETEFEIGKAQVLKDGNDVTIIACGLLVPQALAAAENLESQGISVAVINNHTIKPLDKQTILTYARKTRAILTVEEHQISGGMGSAVAEALVQEYPCPIEFLGVRDSFGQSGKAMELLEEYHLTSPYIEDKVRWIIKRKGGK